MNRRVRNSVEELGLQFQTDCDEKKAAALAVETEEEGGRLQEAATSTVDTIRAPMKIGTNARAQVLVLWSWPFLFQH
jgi:hypothetical protein